MTLFCSFYTPAYADEAAWLADSLDRFGLRHDITGVPSLGDWAHNCARKPSFLIGMMDKWPGTPVVWLDADARVRQPPVLFDTLDCDVAFHRRRGTELLSGTLYFGATAKARELLERWRDGCGSDPHRWDQQTLDAVVGDVAGLRVAPLPGSYVRIFDADDMGEVVIEHRQASRKLKRFA